MLFAACQVRRNHLVLTNLTVVDQGVWYCSAEDTWPMKITVKVVAVRPLPTVLQNLVAVRSNSTVELGCRSTGDLPAPVLTWLDDKDMMVMNSSRVVHHTNGTQVAFLQLSATVERNNTTYFCIAKYAELPKLVQISATSTRVVVTEDQPPTGTIEPGVVMHQNGATTSTRLLQHVLWLTAGVVLALLYVTSFVYFIGYTCRRRKPCYSESLVAKLPVNFSTRNQHVATF